VARKLLRRNRTVRLLAMLDGAPPALTLPPPGLSARLGIAVSTLATLARDFGALAVSLVRHARARPQNYALGRALHSAWRHSAFRLFFATIASARDAKAGRKVDPESRIRPAEIAATIRSLPASHHAFCLTLYDVACRYVPAPAYPGAMLVFESTKEPDRAINRVAAKWRTIAADIKVIPVKGSHMSIMKSPDGIPLANALREMLRNG
jgi:thioesterase domain-containing protein